MQTELVYLKAGYVHLYRYRDGAEFVSPSMVSSITASITKNTQTVADGNSDFDEVFSNGMAGTATVNMNAFEPTFWGAALSAEVDTEATAEMTRIVEVVVPDVAPYTVTLTGTPVAGSDRVLYSNNKALTRAATPPAGEGEYSIETGVLTFNAADAGTAVKVIYKESVTSATTVKLPAMSSNDVFRVTIVGEATVKENPGVTKTDNLVIDRAMVSGEVAPPARQKEAQGHSVTFNVLKPRAGKEPVTYAVEN